MFEFRRNHGDKKWHFCQNCSDWPESDYEFRIGKVVPQTGDPCWECHGRDKCGECDVEVVEESGAKLNEEDEA